MDGDLDEQSDDDGILEGADASSHPHGQGIIPNGQSASVEDYCSAEDPLDNTAGNLETHGSNTNQPGTEQDVPAPSASPESVREVRTTRVSRLDKTDRGKAQPQPARNVEEELIIERERQGYVEDAHDRLNLIEPALLEASKRFQAKRGARNAESQRQSAKIATTHLQQEIERLDSDRRSAERDAGFLDRKRIREGGVYNTFDYERDSLWAHYNFLGD